MLGAFFHGWIVLQRRVWQLSLVLYQHYPFSGRAYTELFPKVKIQMLVKITFMDRNDGFCCILCLFSASLLYIAANLHHQAEDTSSFFNAHPVVSELSSY